MTALVSWFPVNVKEFSPLEAKSSLILEQIGSSKWSKLISVVHDLLPLIYRKNSKNWDTLNYYRDCPTNGIIGFYSAILRLKDADRITNRVDTDQTAP